MPGQTLEEYTDVPAELLELELPVVELVFGVAVVSFVPDPEVPPPQAARMATLSMLAEKITE
jgi:hypothetical protein